MTMHTCVHECTQTHLEAQACTMFTHRVTHTCTHMHRHTWRSLEKASMETGPLACRTAANKHPIHHQERPGFVLDTRGGGTQTGPRVLPPTAENP